MAIPENPITRKEHFLAKAAGENVNTPDPITREEMYLDAIASGSGGGGSALPAVTSDDNGKMLTVVDGAWAADNNRFVVTCTPTAADFSGTMDKTVAEILIAWNAGKEIYFYLPGYATFPVAAITDDETIFAYGVMLGNPGKIIVLETDYHGTGYSTTIYQLTPMGG